MDYPVYKIVVNDDDETGIEFVSLVDKPAIKKDFLKNLSSAEQVEVYLDNYSSYSQSNELQLVQKE